MDKLETRGLKIDTTVKKILLRCPKNAGAVNSGCCWWLFIFPPRPCGFPGVCPALLWRDRCELFPPLGKAAILAAFGRC